MSKTSASIAVLLSVVSGAFPLFAQQSRPPIEIPIVQLVPAPHIEFASAVDSNIPAFWQFTEGQNQLNVFMSWENPSITQGASLSRLGGAQAVRFSNVRNGGRWMESILQD